MDGTDHPPEHASPPAETSGDGRIRLQLQRLGAGDADALEQLISESSGRLLKLVRAHLRRDGRLKTWQQSDDILQGALLRLVRALREIRPGTPEEFFGLAALQVRRELLDLTRHHMGGTAPPVQAGSAEGGRAAPSGQEPSHLASWTEFHRRAGELADPERTVFDLLYYQGLTQLEAAEVLHEDVRRVRRRWQKALLELGPYLPARI